MRPGQVLPPVLLYQRYCPVEGVTARPLDASSGVQGDWELVLVLSGPAASIKIRRKIRQGE